MYFKTFTKSQIAAIFLIASMVQLSSAAPILQNSGFETQNTNFPGNAANWYGGTWAADPSSTISSTVSTSAAASGSYGFLLRPDSVIGKHSAAYVGSDRSPLPGGSLTLSFQFKTISATTGTWSDYKISFFDASNNEITNSTITTATGYSWGAWTRKTHSNIVPPTNAVSITVILSAYASGGSGGEAQWAFDNVLLQSAATKTVLIDFGKDGNNRSLSAPGNWNSVDSSVYWQNLIDSTGTPTTVNLGFVDGAFGGVDSFNGPAGDTSLSGAPGFTGFNSNSVTNTLVDASALGNLAQAEAAFDYFVSSVLVINQLSPAKHYRLSFFGSHQHNTNATTTYTLYGSNPGDTANSSNAVTLSSTNLHVNDGPINGNFWQHNKSRTAELVISNRSSVYIGFIDANGSSSGYLNAMSIEELDVPTAADTTPPVITVAGNNPETVVWGSSYSDAGATAEDAGAAVSVVTDASAVNTAILGSYTVGYTATDTANNIASASRTVNVVLPANANVPGTDGLSPLLRYALGASGPSGAVTKPALATDASDLILTVLIRTSGITAVGQSSTDLSAADAGFANLGSNPNGVPSADQTNLLPGTERREFRTPKDGTRKFLRLKVTQP
jgi:hypothetical protein